MIFGCISASCCNPDSNCMLNRDNVPNELFNGIKCSQSQISSPPITIASTQQPSCISKEIQKFKLPISYLDPKDTFILYDTVANDLELTTSASAVTNTDTKCMYDYLFQPKHSFARFLIPEWKKQYTTNQQFLNDTQHILKNMNTYKTVMRIGLDQETPDTYTPDCDKITEIWDLTKNDEFFLEKYSFLDWNILKYLNKSPYFMQFVTYMNIVSPILSLLIPLLLLVFPFLILRLQRIPISFITYLETLKNIARNHFIGKTLFNLQTISWDKVVYVIFTFVLYLMQIYQNVNTCYRFCNNMNKINGVLIEMQQYTDYSLSSMKTFMSISSSSHSYNEFSKEIQLHYTNLEKLKEELKTIKDYNKNTMKQFNESGNMLKCFYELYENPDYEKSIRFSMGFEAYVNNMLGVYNNYERGIVNFATITPRNTASSCVFEKQIYPPICDDPPAAAIKNDCIINDKNIIISAPNKAGKTTMLKTTTINIIFTQQFGCGFYDDATLTPYTHIHSYLNIPDTSGRDSLFQAESRRCKDIIDIINANSDPEKYRHFCIFDELYSGTNPDEACKAGTAFLKYLCKYPNVNFMLTTHYLSICKRFRNSSSIENYKMDVNILPDGNFEYKYKMRKGISKIKGAIRVLKDMDYPQEIIENIEKDYKINPQKKTKKKKSEVNN